MKNKEQELIEKLTEVLECIVVPDNKAMILEEGSKLGVIRCEE